MRMSNIARWAWRHQDTVAFTQTPVVINTEYPMFTDLVGWKQLIRVLVVQINDEVAAKTINTRCAIDGTTYNVSAALNSGNFYYYGRGDGAGALNAPTLTQTLFMQNESLQCESVEITCEMTDAPGTNQLMRTWVIYSEREFA